MAAAGMRIGDIGVGALDPLREVRGDEEIEDSIDAVGGDAAALRGGQLLGDVIGGRGPIQPQHVEHRGAQRGPLLAALLERRLRGRGERGALVVRMFVFTRECR